VEAEDRYRIEPSHGQSPDKVFERDYARTVLKQVLAALRYECFLSGKGPLFEELKGMFEGDKQAGGYAEMAERLGMTEGAVKKAAQRLRERFHDLLRAEVARTVDDPGEVDEEIRSLFGALVG
jgi:hypothetical protein